MKGRNTLILLIIILAAILCLLIGLTLRQPKPDPQETTGASQSQPSDTQTAPSSQATEPSTEPPTEPSTAPTEPVTEPTEPITEPTEPPTEPTQPSGEMIGSLYTRAELEAMDNTGIGYGPGNTSEGKRPQYAIWDQQKHEKYGANFIAPDNGKVYLTFDCGYEYTATDENGNKYRVTERILDVLKEKNVKAVFFITMPYAKEQPDLVRRMIDEGHAVGNHSNTHPVMPDCSIDKMVWEIQSLHDYVKETFGYEMHLFRFPTGEYSTRSLAVVQTLGYKTVHWSFAYGDYNTDKQPSVESAYETVTSRHHSGAIYLLHAISTSNAAILGDAIDFFIDRGYTLDLFQ